MLEAMDKLKNLIENESYQESIKYLSQSSHFDQAIKDYNLGYIFYKQNDLVQARYQIEKAKLEGLLSTEVNDSLGILRSELGTQTIESNYPAMDNFMFNTVGYNEDVYLTLIGSMLFLFIFLFARAKFIIGSVFLTLFVAFSGFYYAIQDYDLLINTQEYTVYEGPSKIFSEKQIIPKGLKVISSIKAGKWTYINYPESFRGWVKDYEALRL